MSSVLSQQEKYLARGAGGKRGGTWRRGSHSPTHSSNRGVYSISNTASFHLKAVPTPLQKTLWNQNTREGKNTPTAAEKALRAVDGATIHTIPFTPLTAAEKTPTQGNNNLCHLTVIPLTVLPFPNVNTTSPSYHILFI